MVDQSWQTEVDEKLDNLDERVSKNSENIGKLMNAFPQSDLEGHRRAHQTMIDMLEEKRKLRIAIQEKTISGLIWAALVAVGLNGWKWIVAAIKSMNAGN